MKSKIEFLDNENIQPADWKDMLEEYMVNCVDGKITPRQLIGYQKVIAKEIAEGEVYLSILKIRGKFIGFGLYQKRSTIADSGRISELYVREGFRRYGYGTMLETHVCQNMKKLGLKTVSLTPNDTVDFWKKRGYSEYCPNLLQNQPMIMVKNLN